MDKPSGEHWIIKQLGDGFYNILAVLFFTLMAYALYRVAIKKEKHLDT